MAGILIAVPNGKKFAATTPSRTYVPLAVMNGVSSVSSTDEEYAGSADDVSLHGFLSSRLTCQMGWSQT